MGPHPSRLGQVGQASFQQGRRRGDGASLGFGFAKMEEKLWGQRCVLWGLLVCGDEMYHFCSLDIRVFVTVRASGSHACLQS